MLRGNKRKLEHEIDAVLNLKASIHNRFDIEVRDSITGELKQKAQAENIILNALWTKLAAANPNYFLYIHYGSSNTDPNNATYTALPGFIAAKSASFATAAGAGKALYSGNGVYNVRKFITISELENVGSTIREVGIGSTSANSSLVTRALIKDMNGNPISIIKTETDIITIYATVYLHWNENGYDSGAIRFHLPLITNKVPSIEDYFLGLMTTKPTYTVVYAAGGRYLTMTSTTNTAPPGASTAIATQTATTFDVSTKTLTLTAYRILTADCNLGGGIGVIHLMTKYAKPSTDIYMWYPHISLTVGGSWYPNSTITNEAVATGDGATTKFATKFDRVYPGAKIYVDGVEQTSGVTVTNGAPMFAKDLGQYFELVDAAFNPLINPSEHPNPSLPSPITSNIYPSNPDIGEPSAASWAIFYNPFYALGASSFGYSSGSVRNANVYLSDDLVNWGPNIATTPVWDSALSAYIVTIPEAYRYMKYWKITPTDNNLTASCALTGIRAYTLDLSNSYADFKNITFDVAPPNGSAITASYTTKTIAKDTDHVFDLAIRIQIGEKTV